MTETNESQPVNVLADRPQNKDPYKGVVMLCPECHTWQHDFWCDKCHMSIPHGCRKYDIFRRMEL